MSQRSRRQLPVRASNSLLALALTLLTASATAFAQNASVPLQPRPPLAGDSALALEAAAAEAEATNAQASQAQAQAAYEAALTALAQQRWGQAELLLERALMFQSEHAQALLQLATLLAQRDRIESAQALITMLLRDPRTPPGHRRRLQALLDSASPTDSTQAQARAANDGLAGTLRPPGRTQLLISAGHSHNPLGLTSASQLTLTLPEGPVVLALTSQARATAVASLTLHHQTSSGFEIYAQTQTTGLTQARTASRLAIAGPLGLPGHLWSLSTQTTLDGTTRHSAALIKTTPNSSPQVTDAQSSDSPALTTQLTASLWHEPGLERRGWLLRAQRSFLPHANAPLTAWGEYEHSSQGAPGALRSGVQTSVSLAPRWQLQSLLQAQVDTSGYSRLLKNNAPRRLLSLQAKLEYRWPQPLLGGQASASVYAAHRWSNLPLFAWRDHGLRLAWLRQW